MTISAVCYKPRFSLYFFKAVVDCKTQGVVDGFNQRIICNLDLQIIKLLALLILVLLKT